MYRRILVLTGARPDPYRDYNIDGNIRCYGCHGRRIDKLNDIVINWLVYRAKGSESAVAGI